jgi:hypothetical protein
MRVYGVVRKDDPLRIPIKSSSGRFTWDHKTGAHSFLRYLADRNWGTNYLKVMAEHEIATYELTEIKP